MLAGAVLTFPIDMFAQGEADTYSVYEDADAQAACDSTDLPARGFTVLQVVPNTKGKDCYWKRLVAPTAGSPDARSTIEAARARRDEAFRRVDAMRADGWSAFWRDFNGCAGDATCQAQVIRARIAVERDLDAQHARINQRFRNDLQALLHGEIRREAPPGTASRR